MPGALITWTASQAAAASRMPADSPVLPCNKWTWQGPEHIRTAGATGLCSRLGRGAALSLLPTQGSPPHRGSSVRGSWLGRLGLGPLRLSGSLSGSVLIWMQPNLSPRAFEEPSKGHRRPTAPRTSRGHLPPFPLWLLLTRICCPGSCLELCPCLPLSGGGHTWPGDSIWMVPRPPGLTHRAVWTLNRDGWHLVA